MKKIFPTHTKDNLRHHPRFPKKLQEKQKGKRNIMSPAGRCAFSTPFSRQRCGGGSEKACGKEKGGKAARPRGMLRFLSFPFPLHIPFASLTFPSAAQSARKGEREERECGKGVNELFIFFLFHFLLHFHSLSPPSSALFPYSPAVGEGKANKIRKSEEGKAIKEKMK